MLRGARVGRAFRPDIMDGVAFSVIEGAKSGENHARVVEQPVGVGLGQYQT